MDIARESMPKNAPVAVYNCPSCEKLIAKMNIANSSVYNNFTYSDGVVSNNGSPFTPQFSPSFGKCPFCKKIFFLKNLEETNEHVSKDQFEYIGDPVLSDFADAIEQKLSKTPDDEIEIRTCLWRTINNKIRYNRKPEDRDNEEENKFFKSEQAMLWIENCHALLSLLEKKLEELKNSGSNDDEVIDKINNLSLTIAELHRNLGHFDTCFNIIEGLPDSYEWLKYKYFARTAANDQLVFILIAPDENIDKFENKEINFNDPDKTIEYWTKKIETRDSVKSLYYYLRAKAYFYKGEYQAALNDAVIAISSGGDNEDEYYFLSHIYEKLGDNDNSRWSAFKAKHVEAYNKIINDEWKHGNEKLNSLAEKLFITNKDIYIQKNSGKIMLCLQMQENNYFEYEPVESEILYSGGDNALFRRRPDQFILLENVPEDFFIDSKVRSAIFNKKEILISEKSSNTQREYAAKVRLVFEKLDNFESIIRDGYPVYTSLRARVCANMEKRITDVIGREDCANLAAVLAREEDYSLLKKYIDEGLSLNEKVSYGFKSRRPTPFYYISTNRLVGFMENPLKAMRFLAANGADPDIPSIKGDTPLGNQCMENGLSITLKTLLETGADPNCFTEIENGPIKPLHLMLLPSEYDEETEEFIPIRAEDIDKIRLLIEGGANVNYISDTGSTALSLALNNSEAKVRDEIIELLIKKGADIYSAIDALKRGAEQEHPKSAFTLYEIYSGRINHISVKTDSDLARKYLLLSSDLVNRIATSEN